jgi:hypothetical protein
MQELYNIFKTDFYFTIAATPYIIIFFSEIIDLTKQLQV